LKTLPGAALGSADPWLIRDPAVSYWTLLEDALSAARMAMAIEKVFESNWNVLSAVLSRVKKRFRSI